MKRAVALGLAASAAVALGACSQGGGVHTGAGGAQETTIAATDLPHVRAGYWERTDTSNGGAAQVSHFCGTGQAVDLTEVTRNCDSFTLKRTLGGALAVDASCATGTVASTAHVEFSGDYATSYASDAKITITMQGKPPQTFVTHSANRYLGACPAGAPAGT